jgi:hypothetical protein
MTPLCELTAPEIARQATSGELSMLTVAEAVDLPVGI